MKLSPEQEQALRQWASEGASLSDIQSRLASEFDLHPSYMDVRFLVLDLGVDLAERPKPNPTDLNAPSSRAGASDFASQPQSPAPTPQFPDYPGTPYDDGLGPEDADFEDGPEGESAQDDAEPVPQPPAPNPQSPDGAPGAVSVEVSRLAQPGFALNGTVTFSDGVQANWGVTARGELDLVADDHPNYRPSPKDAQAFMVELRKAITKMGY